MSGVTRRAFLASCAAGGLATSAGVGSAASDLGEYEAAWPEHVTLSYPESELLRYRPTYSTPSSPGDRPDQVYAVKASSPEYEYDVYQYWAWYHTQEGLSRWDSHRGDREPVYVYVDEHGTVREACYSGYHWYRARATEPLTYQPDGSDEERVQLRIMPTHHHYVMTDEIGADFDLEPLLTESKLFDEDTPETQYEAWLKNNWASALHPGAILGPDQMRYRATWYRDDTREGRLSRWSAWIDLRLAATPFGRDINTDLQ